MNRTKRVLVFCKIAAIFTLLLPIAVAANAGKKDSSATLTGEKRLMLVPQARLQLATAPIWGDSLEAVVTVVVPDSCKIQRYVCWFETNIAARFATVPRYKWALRRDSLTVLSFMPLQIRAARQSFTSLNQPPVIKIHFHNLDHPAKLSGIATLELLLDGKPALANSLKTDSIIVAKLSADSSFAAQVLSSTGSPAKPDSLANANQSSSFRIFYAALAILLIFLFGALSWLLTWSQRRRLQTHETPTTAMAFPHLQHLQPAASAGTDDKNSTTNENEAPAPTPAVAATTDLPAAISNDSHIEVSTVLTQLHELHMSLQQVIANQQEANRRLAQMTAVTALEVSRFPTRIALFDILNEDSANKHGDGNKTDNGSSPRLRIQFAGDGSADCLSLSFASAAAVHIELEKKDDHFERASLNLRPPSNLRILFAGSESNGSAADEVLLH